MRAESWFSLRICGGFVTFLDERTWEDLRARLPGGCRVMSVLGYGGEATVLHACSEQHPSGIAVKIAHDEEGAERIKNEKEVLGVLRGVPGVVQAFEWERDDPTILTLAIVEGHTMDKFFESGGVTIKQALGLLARLADVLAVVHTRGVVHRDLKPENVIVRSAKKGTSSSSVVLIDFGLGIRIGISPLSGLVSETPAYMSPESFDVTRYPGPAQDLYALGVMLYQVCTGSLPFQGMNLMQVRGQHHVAPIPHLPAEYPSGLGGLLAACLQKRPEHRLADANAFARALREAIAELGSVGDRCLPSYARRAALAQTFVEIQPVS
jgi:serine/threonine protein kinase